MNDSLIRELRRSEIPGLNDLTPEGWSYNLADFFALYFGRPFFHPIVAVLEGKPIGAADGILNGNVGWLGNIVVAPEHRGRGIGHRLTETIMAHFESEGCATQCLVATEMGAVLYAKLGFKVDTVYRFFRGRCLVESLVDTSIRPVVPDDLPGILELDLLVSGENRRGLIEGLHLTGWVYPGDVPHEARGFFLPDLGEGLIIARDREAGLELLRLKHITHDSFTAVPRENDKAATFLLENGFREYNAAKRMFVGMELDWKPGSVFSRIGGYCA